MQYSTAGPALHQHPQWIGSGPCQGMWPQGMECGGAEREGELMVSNSVSSITIRFQFYS